MKNNYDGCNSEIAEKLKNDENCKCKVYEMSGTVIIVGYYNGYYISNVGGKYKNLTLNKTTYN